MHNQTNLDPNWQHTLITGSLLGQVAGQASLEHHQWLAISQRQGWKNSPTHALVVFIVRLFKKVPPVSSLLSEHFGIDPFSSLHLFAIYLGRVFMQFGNTGDPVFIWHTTPSNQLKNKFGVKVNFDTDHHLWLLTRAAVSRQEPPPPSEVRYLKRDEFTSLFFKTNNQSSLLERNDEQLMNRIESTNKDAFKRLLRYPLVRVNTVDIICTLGFLAKMLENKRNIALGNTSTSLKSLQLYYLLDVTDNYFAQLFPSLKAAQEKIKMFQKFGQWRKWETDGNLDDLPGTVPPAIKKIVELVVGCLSPFVKAFYKDPASIDLEELQQPFTIFNVCRQDGVFDSIHLLQTELCSQELHQLAVHLLARTGICSADLLQHFSGLRRRQKGFLDSIMSKEEGIDRDNAKEQYYLFANTVGSNPCIQQDPTFVFKQPLLPL